MKKILYLITLICILSSPALAETMSVLNSTTGTVLTGVSYLKVNLVNQNPSTADPGGYVDLLFKVENRGTIKANNVTLKIIPQYPFSLDPSVSDKQELGTMNGLQSGNDAFLVRYKLRVDNNAADGDSEIKLKYSEGDSSAYYVQTFNVSVSNPRTDFDVVAQDSTTLAIANIGDNTASSVIVRIPEQQGFRVNGTSASILGNLNAGDYTLVTFQLSPIRNSNVSNAENNLIVEVSYTDTLGIRRTVQKNVLFEFAGVGFDGNFTGRLIQRGQTQSFLGLSGGLLYIVIGVIGIVVIIVIVKLRTRKKK